MAFTLAEVLITLGVIGVVAALTMPALIQNHKKNVTVNRLKSAVSLMQNAIKMAEVKHGFTSEWEDCEDNGLECTTLYYEKYLAPELKIVKSCIPTSDECWSNTKTLSNQAYLTNGGDGKHISAILSNGMSFYMWRGKDIVDNNNPHIQLWFDLDGPRKGKNTLGHDVFGMIIYFRDSDINKKGVNLIGAEVKTDNTIDVLKNDAGYGCNNLSARYAGRHCGALIQYNGWKIPDDYPW